MKKLFIMLLMMAACSKTPLEPEIHQPIVCTDTTFVNDTTTVVDTTCTITDPDPVILFLNMHDDIDAVIRTDKGEEHYTYERVAYFSYGVTRTYKVYTQVEYSESASTQLNESFYLTFNDNIPLDPNAGNVYVVQDLNDNTIRWINRRYAGTWSVNAHTDYSVDFNHYIKVASQHPQFKNSNTWDVESIKLFSIILEEIR